VEYLVSRGANINPGPGRKNVALAYAIRAASTDVVLFLLEHGADPNVAETTHDEVPCSFERTPLIEAMRKLRQDLRTYRDWVEKMPSILTHLLNFGAQINKPDGYGNTALRLALQCLRLDYSLGIKVSSDSVPNLIQTLLKHGADPNQSSNGEYTPFMMVMIGFGFGMRWIPQTLRLQVVEMMIPAGADVNARTPHDTPLTLAFHAYELGCDLKLSYDTLKELYETELERALQKGGVSETDRISLSDVPDDECRWDSQVFPVLLRAGATVGQADLDSIKVDLGKREKRWAEIRAAGTTSWYRW